MGGGTGTPAAGNWLICLTGWNQTGITAATHAVRDDIHSFWHPGDEDTSQWAVSSSAGASRASIWYAPNIALAAGNVYIAPSGAVDGRAVLVIEVAGMGPWDTVTGIDVNYAAAATSLSLSLSAPSAQALVIGAVCGDLTGAGQAFAPASWTTLPTVTAQNGTDHTADAVLTSAWIVTSGSVSVTATATSATDLAGVLLAVETSAASPIPAGQNPDWPPVRCEAAWGAGFQTPPDQLTWTDLSQRLWKWDEETGIQYELGEIQATNLSTEIDNVDGNLASDNPGSIWYSDALNSNMSFQSGVSPWAGNDNAAIAQSSAHSYASSAGAIATYSMQVTPDGVTSFPGAMSERVAVSASTQYTASAWFYSVAGYATGAQVAFAWYTSGGTFISFSTATAVAVPAATWTQVTETATSPGTAAFAAIIVQFSGTPTTAPFWVAEAAFVSGSSAVATGRVTAGTPLRLRVPVGTMGGVTANRWYCIWRNMQQVPQQVDPALRRYAPVTGTDIWAAMSAYGPTPYRGEVLQDSPYAWWPMDDQPGSGGVLPKSLRNAAPGNSHTLSITLSPNGDPAQTVYSTLGGVSQGPPNGPPLTLAVYTVGQNPGWMYGDPQASAASLGSSITGGLVTAQPGSSAWTHTGAAGNTGANGWFMSCNDAGFPPLSGGVTIEAWFSYPFFGTTTFGSFTRGGGTVTDIAAEEPYCPLTIWEIATGSNPVAVLQLDISGHLNFITYNGATGTSHSIYSTADLRTDNWHQVTVTTDGNAWTVWLDGGALATVSGTGAGMTSAWTWLILNGDLGTHGGSTAGTGLVHGGNVSLAHFAVYPAQLPAYRIIAHYWAAFTAFGVIPAPTGVTVLVSSQSNNSGTISVSPDGSTTGGSYGGSSSIAPGGDSMSGVVVAAAGSYTSGPSAWTATYGFGYTTYAWVGWTTGLAPKFYIYNSEHVGAEQQASVTVGAGDAFTSGFGAAAVGTGFCHAGSGSGASAPSSPTATGDTVGQRIERIVSYAGASGLGYGGTTNPCRAIDPASLLVQAATDIGGQQSSQNLLNIADSDGGWLYVDNMNTLTYWQKSHLAGQYSSPVWTLTPDSPPTAGASSTAIPYARTIDWNGDPQRIWNSITITPFAPDGAQLPLVIPSGTASLVASQEQTGSQPLQITSYLQSTTEMASQADWLLANYGTTRIRIEGLEVDACSHPAAWPLVLGVNIGDLCSVQNWQIGGGGITGIFRVSGLHRTIQYGGMDEHVQGSVVLQLDMEPPSYWS